VLNDVPNLEAVVFSSTQVAPIEGLEQEHPPRQALDIHREICEGFLKQGLEVVPIKISATLIAENWRCTPHLPMRSIHHIRQLLFRCPGFRAELDKPVRVDRGYKND
jgi:hypothetical protein